MTLYSYTPVKSFDRETRLLTLLPGNMGEDIHVQISIQKVTSTSTPSYEAISYAWGTIEDLSTIYVGTSKDFELSVTRNLASALQHLRRKDESRTLWVDAICINQHDLEERSQQVRMMADIYRLARRVVAWVGPAARDSSIAMEVLQALGTNVEVDWVMSHMKPSQKAEIEEKTHWANRSIKLPFQPEEGIPIRHFLNRSWFERLWIWQEIGLASSDAILMCGFDTLSWQLFRTAVFCLFYKTGQPSYFGKRKAEFKRRLKMIYHIGVVENQGIGNIFYNTIHSKCSDPRDRIYALLSLFDRTLNIVPDYNLSKAEVYQDFCLRYVDSFEFGNFNILSWCEMPLSPSDLPSWVPDWSIARVSGRFGSEDQRKNSFARVHYLGGGVLRASGVQVATIKHADELFVTSLTTTSEIVTLIRRIAPPNMDTIRRDSFDTYCRTLCANSFCDYLDPPVPGRPSLDTSRKTLGLFLGPEGNAIRGNVLDPEMKWYVNEVASVMLNRSFFSTDEGHIGLGPSLAKSGDKVVVFPGCNVPMALRSTKDGRYKVVGACYIWDFSHDETFLGPLPEEYQPILKIRLSLGTCDAYRNRNTGRIQTVDPRLSLFRSERRKDGVRRLYVQEPEVYAATADDSGAVRIRISDEESKFRVYEIVGIKTRPFDLV